MAGQQRSRRSCGKTRHATFTKVMKTDEIRTHQPHPHTHALRNCLRVSAQPASVGLRTELASISHAPFLSPLLTQIYCKEIAAQIGMHVHVKVALGLRLSENTV